MSPPTYTIRDQNSRLQTRHNGRLSKFNPFTAPLLLPRDSTATPWIHSFRTVGARHWPTIMQLIARRAASYFRTYITSTGAEFTP